MTAPKPIKRIPTSELQLSPACKYLQAASAKLFQTGAKSAPHKRRAALQDAASFAVRYGMKWHVDDFTFITRPYYEGGWGGHDILSEHLYGLACGRERGYSNPSFCTAWEKFHKRPPFILKDESRSGRRIYEGMQLRWANQNWTLTSFAQDGSYINAVQYVAHEYNRNGFEVGAAIHEPGHSYRRIETVNEDGTQLTLSPRAETVENKPHAVKRRLRITPAMLAEFNRTHWEWADRTDPNYFPPHADDVVREAHAWFVVQSKDDTRKIQLAAIEEATKSGTFFMVVLLTHVVARYLEMREAAKKFEGASTWSSP